MKGKLSAAILAIAGLFGVAYTFRSPAPDSVASKSPSVAPSAMTVLTPRESMSHPAPLPPARPNETRTAQIDRLAKGTPAEALEAVKLLQACAYVEPFERHAAESTDPKIQKLLRELAPAGGCEGVMAGQRTMILPLAIKAAQANVPGAFAQLMGMSAQYPEMQDDASFKQAWGDILASNLKAANPDALMARYLYESNCSDPPKCTGRDLGAALTHWTTYIDAKGGKLTYGPDVVTPQLTKALGDERAQAAIAAGHAAFVNREQQ